MKKVFLFLAGLLLAGKAFAADVYTIDTAHSTIGFSVKHLMVATTNGSFGDYTGTITYDVASPGTFAAEATIQAGSIDTNNTKRDEHLRSADFLDVGQFPTITFVAKSLKGSPGVYTLTGDLTIKGVTKEVNIPITIQGPAAGMAKDLVIGLSGQLIINRQDFGITWNKALDNGGLAVANDVKINIELEAHKKQ